MLSRIITENEFDNLAEQSQMRYLYCPDCKLFYLAGDSIKHLCGQLKKIIRPFEYDQLTNEKKLEYMYCAYCNTYTLKLWSKKCICEEG